MQWVRRSGKGKDKGTAGIGTILKSIPDSVKNKWNHWAFSHDGKTGMMSIYLNGQFFEKITNWSKNSKRSDPKGYSSSSNPIEKVSIGPHGATIRSRARPSDNIEAPTGTIALSDVIIYNRILRRYDVEAIYIQGSP